MLLVTAVLGMCFAIAALQYRRATKRDFEVTAVRPITDNFVSSVGYSNGRILWLRVNAIDPHHPNGFDEWVVPISMDMYSNAGAFGPYKTFGDDELKKVVTAHPHLRALDLRSSAVTDAGLCHLSNLKQLEWLWLDDQQSSATGLALLHNIPSLRKIWLPLDSVDNQLLDELRNALRDCIMENSSNLDEVMPIPEST